MPQCVCSCSRRKEEERRARCVLTWTARLEEDQIVSGLSRRFEPLHSGTFKINQEAFSDVLCRRSVSCYAEVYLGPCLPFPYCWLTHTCACVCLRDAPTSCSGFFLSVLTSPFSRLLGLRGTEQHGHVTLNTQFHPTSLLYSSCNTLPPLLITGELRGPEDSLFETLHSADWCS